MDNFYSWTNVINVVKEPITLAALVVLCLTLILRISLSKVKVLRGSSAYRTTIYSISVVFFLSLITIVGALGFNFYKVYIAHSSKQPILTRLETENILQKNRGNIEHCISSKEDFYVIDFVFSSNQDAGINIDIYVNHDFWKELGPGEDPAHPDRIVYREMLARENVNKVKLGVYYPNINRCLIDALKDKINHFRLENNSEFIHRYIKKNGIPIFNAYKDHPATYDTKIKYPYSTYDDK